MVLIGKGEAVEKLRSDRALDALITILFDPNGSIAIPSRYSQTDDAIVGALFSIQSGKEVEFRQAAELLLRRKIGPDSDWVHDDLLAFSIIVGNLSFGGYDELTEELLRARSLGTDDDQGQKVTQSLRALKCDQADAPILSILVVGRLLAFPNESLNGSLVASAYEQSIALEFDLAIKQFLRLLGEKVAVMALKMSAVDNASEFSRLKKFLIGFEKRAKLFSCSVFGIILILVVAVWIYVVKLYFSPDDATEELAGKLFQMGVVVAPITLILVRRPILLATRRFFYRFFGGRELL